MVILLTNDDGFNHPGLTVTRKSLQKGGHRVTVVAPDGNRSCSSHAVTVSGAVTLKQIDEDIFKCSGTPADCVHTAISSGMVSEPDLIISGINQGANLGSDIIYSGTVSAAREGALKGINSLAISLAAAMEREPEESDYTQSAEFICENMEKLIVNLSREHFININFPSGSYRGVRLTTPTARRNYQQHIETFDASRNYGTYCFNIAELQPGTSWPVGEDYLSDIECIDAGFASISPVAVLPQPYKLSSYAANWSDWSSHAVNCT